MEKKLENKGKLAVISCTHGNLPALKAVLDDINAKGIKKVIHLGDSVGYGPEPEETVALLRERQIASIQGCWDKSIGASDEDCGCDFVNEQEAERGRELFAWTYERTSTATRTYLRELPEQIRCSAPCGHVLFVHGSPRSANEYLSRDLDPLVLLERTHTAHCDILVCGHTHVPFIQKVSGFVALERPHPHKEETSITEMLVDPKYVFNAGSVGEPLHGPEATYMIMDLDSGYAEIVYLPYDVEETLRRMEKAYVPSYVIERFRRGDDITQKNRSCQC